MIDEPVRYLRAKNVQEGFVTQLDWSKRTKLDISNNPHACYDNDNSNPLYRKFG